MTSIFLVEIANFTLQVAAHSSVFSSCYPRVFQVAQPWASSKREHLSQAGGAAKRLLRLRFTEKTTVFFRYEYIDLVNNYQTSTKQYDWLVTMNIYDRLQLPYYDRLNKYQTMIDLLLIYFIVVEVSAFFALRLEKDVSLTQEKREQRRRWLEDLERPEEETEAVDGGSYRNIMGISWEYHGNMLPATICYLWLDEYGC